MSRISRMERLQRGQEPRLSHSSLEHTLQKVCPHGINAAPFFLPMHTQHTESFPKTFSSFSSLLLLISQDTCFGALRRELDLSQSEIMEVNGDSSLSHFARVLDS